MSGPGPTEAAPDHSPGRGAGRVWIGYLAAGTALAIGSTWLPQGVPGDVAYVSLGLSAVMAVLIGLRWHRPSSPGPWRGMAVGLGLWVVADLIGSIRSTGLGLDTFPTPADPFYLVGYLVLILALWWLARHRRPGPDWPGLLDSAVVTAGLALVLWVLIAAPALEEYRDDPLTAAVAVAYPVTDILLIAALTRLIATPGARTPSLRLLVIAIALLILADTSSTGLGLLTFDSSRTLDPLWLLSYVAWGASALHPSMRSTAAPQTTGSRGLSRARLIILTAAVMLAPAVLALEKVMGGRIDVWPYVIGSVLLFGLVMLRTDLAVRQIVSVDRQRRQLESDLAHQTSHDALTQLPNRARLRQLLRLALNRSEDTGSQVGLIYIDLDRFTAVNDALGHETGDEVLRGVGERLLEQLGGREVVARIGGDKFAVLVEPVDTESDAIAGAEQLLAALREPMSIEGLRPVRVSASMGIAISQPGLLDPELMVYEADVAAHQAKSQGRGRVVVFDTQLRRELSRKSAVERDLGAALTNGDLELRFTPALELVSGEVHWFSASTYWMRGTDLLAPSAFMADVSQLDLVRELDAWKLREAVARLSAWQGFPYVQIAVAVSPARMSTPGLAEEVVGALAAFGVAPPRLVVAVTVQTLFGGSVARTNLAELRRHAVGLAVNGYGTGPGPDSRLAGLGLDLAWMPYRPNAEEHLHFHSLVQTAHAFGLRVVAEGVSTPGQLRRVEELGCTAAQGLAVGTDLDALAATASLQQSWTSPV